jgi:hypothetical protein
LTSPTAAAVQPYDFDTAGAERGLKVVAEGLAIAPEGPEEAVEELIESGNVVVPGDDEARVRELFDERLRRSEFRPTRPHCQVPAEHREIRREVRGASEECPRGRVISGAEVRIGEVEQAGHRKVRVFRPRENVQVPGKDGGLAGSLSILSCGMPPRRETCRTMQFFKVQATDRIVGFSRPIRLVRGLRKRPQP